MMSIPSPPRMASSSPIHETRSENDSPLHIDLHQDLFPDYYGGPTPIAFVMKEKFPRNDTPNGINDSPPTIKESNFPATSVPPSTTGKGYLMLLYIGPTLVIFGAGEWVRGTQFLYKIKGLYFKY
ncbi:uncharacterized protein LOC120128462 isoform X2 [Hibiscus syriacus]|uniref:uncharacterized protein LOC120128462 isoform X2 n=1 Tax=Hibiscus syriacus TaxID=106335 RepID=UPI0019245F42|nr:uncharacterized protein LOC120128462 isoform X2 [Hibiscus syriacus]